MRHRTADLEPTNFGGRYTLIRRLAVGGMAEIYLARQAAMAGFEKEVVIKRLRAELADDPRIVEMFLDEARIGALLNHPNIVHVYDVDEHDGIPYIAMEYIIGEELNELCRRGLQHAKFLPLEHAVELMRQAAAGMGYFHAKRGVEGGTSGDQPLEIVHLDISPSNLLVTQDGFLKIIDFGIARARGQHNRGDVMPGKLSYMSPEQSARGEVDHRSDVFSLGIVLYEITVGKRLFRGNAAEVVKKLQEGKVEPPTFARRNYPAALESIVLRTLERHPGDRYQSAYDLADDLESFLRDERLHSGPVRIARYLDTLTLAAGGQRRPELVSEAEARRDGEDLDFDKHFEGPPPEPRPEQWEDAEQPEGEVAAALGMDLAELRALRTPVPVRVAGMTPIPAEEPTKEIVVPRARPITHDDEPDTGPAERVDVSDLDDVATVTNTPPIDPAEVDTDFVAALERPKKTPTPRPRRWSAGPDPAAIARRARETGSFTKPEAETSAAPVATKYPTIGSAYLKRSGPSRLPWFVAIALLVAVLALVAYIVWR